LAEKSIVNPDGTVHPPPLPATVITRSPPDPLGSDTDQFAVVPFADVAETR
jgi:hypothetical protein